MANENARNMDGDLKDAIYHFFKQEYEYKYASARDFVDDLEEHLKEKGFDLGCVIQYKNK